MSDLKMVEGQGVKAVKVLDGKVIVCAVEFPAVLLNTSTGEVESEFHSYVQPQERPTLSDFCTELTGITQVQCPLQGGCCAIPQTVNRE